MVIVHSEVESGIRCLACRKGGREVHSALHRIGVWSYRKRRELAGILLHPNPPHLYRVYLGGFLLYALNLSVEEATAFIERYSVWVDFDRRITERNLRGIHKRGRSSNSAKSANSSHSSNSSNSSNMLSSEIERLGSDVWVGRCCANGYCLEWHRVFLFG